MVLQNSFDAIVSLADGSDFVIKNYAGTITQAIGLNCSPQFDYDYLELLLSDPLPAGNYSLVLQNGSDGNTLTEDCGSQALVGDKMDFSVSEIIPDWTVSSRRYANPICCT